MTAVPPEVDRHPYRAATVCGLLLVVLTLVWSCVVAPAVKGWEHPVRWWIPGDVWVPIGPAHHIQYGAFPYLYEANSAYVYPPGTAMLFVPVAVVGDAVHLSETSTAVSVPRPTLWLVIVPFGGCLEIGALVALRRLLWTCGRRTLLSHLQVVAALAATPVVTIWGHFEEVAVVGLLCVSARLCLRRRYVPMAAALGAAVLVKQTAVLAAPLLLLQVPAGPVRRRCVALTFGLPAGLVAMCLVADWSHASTALFASRSFPALGRAALWAPSAPSTSASAVRALAPVIALMVGLAVRRRHDAAALISSLALVMLIRLAVEPVLYAYYLGAPVTLALVATAVGRGRWAPTAVAGAVMYGMFLIPGHPLAWWGAFLVLAIALAAGPASAFARLSPRHAAAG